MDRENVLTPEQYERNIHLTRYGKRMYVIAMILLLCGVVITFLGGIPHFLFGVEGPPHILVMITAIIGVPLTLLGYIMGIVYSRSKYSPQEIFTLYVYDRWIRGQPIATSVRIYANYFAENP